MAEIEVDVAAGDSVMETRVNSTAKLYLTDRTLHYAMESQLECEIYLEDVIGVKVEELLLPSEASKLTVHYFPLISRHGKKYSRKQSHLSLVFGNSETGSDNFKEASLWKNKILLHTQTVVSQTFVNTGGSSSINDTKESEWKRRNLLVLLNPFAGDQKGEQKFNRVVRPMFDLAEINYTVQITEHPNHACDLVQELDLSTYDGIVISSGDGLLYEVINGFMKRPDWEEAIKIPLGMLPTGTGNALAASTLYEAGEEFSLEAAAFQIIRGGFTPMDVATVQTIDNKQCYMTLLGNWGIMADIDIESESMRRLGEARLTLWTLIAVLRKRVYRGKLSYLPCDDDLEGSAQRKISSPVIPTASTGQTDVENQDSSLVSANGHHEPQQVDSHSPVECSFSPLEVPAAIGQGDTSGNTASDLSQCLSIAREISSSCAEEKHVITKPSFPGPPTDLLVPLDCEVPDTWKTFEGEHFLSITPLMVPFLSQSCFGDPNFQVGSGNIHLVCVRGSTSKWNALKLLINTKTGKHMEMEEVSLIKAKAFRIEPEHNAGIMTVDGERVETGPLQAQLHPCLAVVMSRKRK